MKPSIFALSLSLAALLGTGTGCGRPSQPQPVAKPVSSTAPGNAPAAAPASELPPGHPPLNSSGGSALPAGHPPLPNNAMPGMAGQSLPAETLGKAATPKWTVPAGWEQRASSMRRGSFLASGPDGQAADIAVTVFPGDVGGALANVNRWRGQIGLEPVKDLAPLTTKLELNGIQASLVDLEGQQPPEGKKHPARMLVVTIPHNGNSWFIKMTGDAPLVAAQKEALLAFVKSFQF